MKSFYLQKPTQVRGNSEPKKQEKTQSNLKMSMSQKMHETQTKWNGLIARTVTLEQNLLRLRDSVNQTLRGGSKESTSSKSTAEQLHKPPTLVNMTSRIASPMLKKVSPQDCMTMSRIQTYKTVQSWFPKSRFQTFEGIPQFRIGKLLGRGQFSDVHLCIDKLSGTIFALKVIKKEKIQDEQLQKQVIQEIKVQMKLNHPNIVKLYNCYSDELNLYLLMEYCNEGELFKVQRKQPGYKFPENKASYYIHQILQCIQYMHQNKVMHRDLKTENIMLSFNQIKIGDFGCVCSNQDRRETFCGTIEFMAPEVIQMKGYDSRVDAWQIAVLAYELVYGQTPFVLLGNKDQKGIMDNILKHRLTIPHTFSSELTFFVKGGLQSDPNKRLSIEQMLKHPWITKHKLPQTKCEYNI
ncbi:unnamed protein product [Paramecium sonneborni]|uniref:Aurora kinase n=1 Tax=Paramecium sonneborni TaxID=65129 RepID=A0A8S1QPK1_9CILI|nr:unnamed protein product [Paramecium sonneborni]